MNKNQPFPAHGVGISLKPILKPFFGPGVQETIKPTSFTPGVEESEVVMLLVELHHTSRESLNHNI